MLVMDLGSGCLLVPVGGKTSTYCVKDADKQMIHQSTLLHLSPC